MGKVQLIKKAIQTITKTSRKSKLVDSSSDLLFDFAKKHSLFTRSGDIADNGLALVHMTDYVPKTGKILSDRAIYNGTRSSVHFAVNHAVEAVNGGLANWSSAKYAVILPFSKTKQINEAGTFIGGMTTDIWTKGSVKLPKGTVIVRRAKGVPKGKLRIVNAETIKRFKELKGVRIIETSKTPHSMVDSILQKLGYTPIRNASSQWGGLGNQATDLISGMEKWNKFAKKHGVIPGVHSVTPSAAVEKFVDDLLFNKGFDVIPFRIIKKGTLVVDYQQEMLRNIREIKKIAQEKGYHLSIDVNKLENIIANAKNFKEIKLGIKKQFKLQSIAFHHPATREVMIGCSKMPPAWQGNDDLPYTIVSGLRRKFKDSLGHFSSPRTITNFHSETDLEPIRDTKILELLSDSPTTYYPKSKKALWEKYIHQEKKSLESQGILSADTIEEMFSFIKNFKYV